MQETEIGEKIPAGMMAFLLLPFVPLMVLGSWLYDRWQARKTKFANPISE